jgi:hypothetical protein
MQTFFDVLITITSGTLVVTFVVLSYWININHWRLAELGHYLSDHDSIRGPKKIRYFYYYLSASYFIVLYISISYGLTALLWWLPNDWGWWSDDYYLDHFTAYRDVLAYVIGFFCSGFLHGEFSNTLRRIHQRRLAEGLSFNDHGL